MPAGMGRRCSTERFTCRKAGPAIRRAVAGVPERVGFATKPRLGRALLAHAFAAGVRCAWVTADSVYGADYGLRRFIERHGRGYVLAVTSAQRLALKPVADWLEDVPARAWRGLSAGDGSNGPRLYDWAYLPYRSDAAPGWHKGLLIRRKIKKPVEFTFYLTLSPNETALAKLVRVAGARWTIEACFEAAKGEVGLDRCEVRSWTGRHRHITGWPRLSAVLRHAAAGGKTGTGYYSRISAEVCRFQWLPLARCWWRRRQRDQAQAASRSGGRAQTRCQSRRRTSGTVSGSRSALRSTMPCFPARGAAEHGEIGMRQHRQRDVAMPVSLPRIGGHLW